MFFLFQYHTKENFWMTKYKITMNKLYSFLKEYNIFLKTNIHLNIIVSCNIILPKYIGLHFVIGY